MQEKVITLATPVFFALIALELAWGWLRGRNTYRLDGFDRVFASPSNHRVRHAVNDRFVAAAGWVASAAWAIWLAGPLAWRARPGAGEPG